MYAEMETIGAPTRHDPDGAGGSYQRRGQLSVASSPQLGAKDGVEQLIDCPYMRTVVSLADAVTKNPSSGAFVVSFWGINFLASNDTSVFQVQLDETELRSAPSSLVSLIDRISGLILLPGNEAREVADQRDLYLINVRLRPLSLGQIVLSPSNATSRADGTSEWMRRARSRLCCAFPRLALPLNFSREVTSNDATAIAARNSYQKSLYKLDIPVGIVPTLIVTILRHVRDVSVRVLSLWPGARFAFAVSIARVHENLKESPVLSRALSPGLRSRNRASRSRIVPDAPTRS
ncbi:hypothetical protein WN48_01072 [Eufriesea mexicana]|nr:hypothetical protein WN48_01072 [Eufriesea mexicana]